MLGTVGTAQNKKTGREVIKLGPRISSIPMCCWMSHFPYGPWCAHLGNRTRTSVL